MEELPCPVLIFRPFLFYAPLGTSNSLEQHAIPRALYTVEVEDGPFRPRRGCKPIDGTELYCEAALVF